MPKMLQDTTIYTRGVSKCEVYRRTVGVQYFEPVLGRAQNIVPLLIRDEICQKTVGVQYFEPVL